MPFERRCALAAALSPLARAVRLDGGQRLAFLQVLEATLGQLLIVAGAGQHVSADPAAVQYGTVANLPSTRQQMYARRNRMQCSVMGPARAITSRKYWPIN